MNGANDPTLSAPYKKAVDGITAQLDAQLDPLTTVPPTTATADLSPLGAATTPAAAPSPGPALYGSERIVDIIRREQKNQIAQMRSKGTTTQYQKSTAAVPFGSGKALSIRWRDLWA